MEDCIFCKIIQGEIPSAKIYEDDQVYAFLDISQVTTGHTLLIPKQHVKDIFAYDSNLASQVFSRVPMVAQALKASLPEMKGLNIVNNNGEVAYQSVFHSHIHLIPRYDKNDGFTMTFPDNSDNFSSEDYQSIANNIAGHISH